jgi:hypothetical protein
MDGGSNLTPEQTALDCIDIDLSVGILPGDERAAAVVERLLARRARLKRAIQTGDSSALFPGDCDIFSTAAVFAGTT